MNKGQEIIRAVKAADCERIRQLVEEGANVDAYHCRAIYQAVNDGEIDVAKTLLDLGADTNASYDDNETILMIAVKNLNVPMTRLLLENNANVNASDRYGYTALMWAANTVRQQDVGQVEIARILLGYGADPNARNDQGMHSLILSGMRGQLDISKMLLERGADVHIADINGQNALYWARNKNQHDTEVFLTGYMASFDEMTILGKAIDKTHFQAESDLFQF